MKKVSLTLIFALLLLACQKDSLSEVELQTTISISNIQITTADVNLTGQVLNPDESFNWGVAYSVNPDPRMDNNRGNATTSGNSISDNFTITNLLPDTVYYIQPFVELNNEFYFGEEIVEFRTDTLPYGIGGFGPAGGLVYYINLTESWGMEMSTATFPSNNWRCSDDVEGTSREVGTGANNSNLILSVCSETETAVTKCDEHIEGGYSDWHLPAVDDLVEIDSNLVSTGLWDPGAYAHQSSSQSTYPASNDAFLMYQWSGHYVFWNYKTYEYNFMPVRRFDF